LFQRVADLAELFGVSQLAEVTPNIGQASDVDAV
jgi:hypothetical protein